MPVLSVKNNNKNQADPWKTSGKTAWDWLISELLFGQNHVKIKCTKNNREQWDPILTLHEHICIGGDGGIQRHALKELMRPRVLSYFHIITKPKLERTNWTDMSWTFQFTVKHQTVISKDNERFGLIWDQTEGSPETIIVVCVFLIEYNILNIKLYY